MSDDTRGRRSSLGSKRQLPSGRWRVRVSHGYRADGRQRVVSETVDTEEEADRRILEIAQEMGRDPGYRAGLTLRMLWRDYLRGKGDRLAAKTLSAYTWHMDRHWLPALGDEDVSQVTHWQVQQVLLAQTRQVAQHARVALSSVLAWGVQRGVLSANVAREDYELPGDTGDAWEDEAQWDEDPFGAIERGREVWDASTVLRALPLVRGLTLEPVWLAMVGAGLRMEEAFALRPLDVREKEIAGRTVVQVAVHHATPDSGERKRTKTRGSVRIVAVMEPFGQRLLELARAEADPRAAICKADPARQNKAWRNLFADPPTSRHTPRAVTVRGRLAGFPYVPLSRMRATHSTLMQEAGVPDSLNAAAHGHSEDVARQHYMRGDTTAASEQTERFLALVA